MFFPFVEHLTTKLSDRLLQVEDQLNAQYLIPTNYPAYEIRSIYNTFQSDLPAQDLAEFQCEIHRWSGEQVTLQKKHHLPLLANANRELYPNIVTCLPVLLAMPVATATAEHSFSSMLRLKTYLLSTMSTWILSELGLKHILRDRDINTDLVIDASPG